MNKLSDFPFTKKCKEIINNTEVWRDCSPSYPPCGVCRKIIYDIPLMVYDDNHKVLSFHIKCAVEGEAERDEECKINKEVLVSCKFCEQNKECPHIDYEKSFG